MELLRPRVGGKVTPESTRAFIADVPLYARDTEDPSFWELERIRQLQAHRLRTQIGRVLGGSEYYQKVFAAHGLTADDILDTDDLVKLPVTQKRDYMAEPESFRLHPTRPGLYDSLWDVSYTTGTTTGVPTPFYNTVHDYYGCCLLALRVAKIQGGRPEDVYLNLFPLGPIPHIGFLRTRDTGMVLRALSCSPCTGIPHPDFPIHSTTADAIDLIEQRRPDWLVGIASYLRRLVLAGQAQGRDFSSIKGVQMTGEPAPAAMREDVRRRLAEMGAGEDIMISNSYGFTEMQGIFAECFDFAGCHNPDPAQFFFEVVDGGTGQRLDEGERGLLCITHLNRTGTVLLRYAVGDLAVLTRERCPYCGRTSERVIIAEGSTYATRTSDLIKVKGTLINPDVLLDALANTPGVSEYQVVLDKEDPQDPFSPDVLLVRIGAAGPCAVDDVEKEVAARVLAAVEVRPRVQFVDPSDIFDPSSSLKAKRIVDRRPRGE